MNEDLLNKLKKLLNLSKSGNQFEAELALQKATAMAVDNGIDLAIIASRNEKVEEKLEMVEEEIQCGQRLPSLQKYASWLLKSQFNVEIVYSGGRYGGRCINILGDKKDVEFAKFVNEFVQDDMQRRWEYYKKSNSVSISFKQTFMYNLYLGLNAKLNEAKNKAEETRFSEMGPSSNVSDVKAQYSLVISNKKDAVQAFLKKSYSNLSRSKTRINANQNSTVARDGYSIGQTMTINRPLSC